MAARRRLRFAAIVLVAAGCTTVPDGGPPQASTVAVTPDHPATLQVDAGLRVDLDAGSVAGPASLSARQVPSAEVPAPLQATGPVWQIDLTGSLLLRPATLTWTVPPATDGAPPAARPVFYDDRTGQWSDVDARPGPTADTLVVTTQHFSRWALLRWSADALKDIAATALTSILAPAPTASPACPDPDGAKAAGVRVTSSDGDLARWCVGRTGGATVLHVTNNRGYALSLLRPTSWTMRSLGPGRPLLDALADTVAAWSTPAPKGYRSEILGPGETVELTVRGPYTDVAVSPSGVAFDLSAIVYGLDTLAMVYGKVPGGPDVSNGKLVELAHTIMQVADCVTGYQKLLTADPRTPEGLADLFKSAVTLTFTCIEKAWATVYGAKGVLATFWLGAVVWLADGVGQIIEGVRALFDTVQNIGGYNIHVTPPEHRTRRPEPKRAGPGRRGAVGPGGTGGTRRSHGDQGRHRGQHRPDEGHRRGVAGATPERGAAGEVRRADVRPPRRHERSADHGHHGDHGGDCERRHVPRPVSGQGVGRHAATGIIERRHRPVGIRHDDRDHRLHHRHRRHRHRHRVDDRERGADEDVRPSVRVVALYPHLQRRREVERRLQRSDRARNGHGVEGEHRLLRGARGETGDDRHHEQRYGDHSWMTRACLGTPLMPA